MSNFKNNSKIGITINHLDIVSSSKFKDGKVVKRKANKSIPSGNIHTSLFNLIENPSTSSSSLSFSSSTSQIRKSTRLVPPILPSTSSNIASTSSASGSSVNSLPNISLADIKSEKDILNLTVVKIKEILKFNSIDYKYKDKKKDLVKNLMHSCGLGNQTGDNYDVFSTPMVVSKSAKPRQVNLEETDDYCKICMETKIDCVLPDCGHFCLCFKCGEQLKECPICRISISKVIKIYKS